MDADRLLDRKEAAAYLGISPDTLSYWKCKKKQDIPTVKLGKRCLYRKADLDAFIASRIVTHGGGHNGNT